MKGKPKAIMEFKKDLLCVKLLPTRLEMGKTAASDVHDCLISLLAQKEEVNVIFAAAPSQNETLSALCEYGDIDFSPILEESERAFFVCKAE